MFLLMELATELAFSAMMASVKLSINTCKGILTLLNTNLPQSLEVILYNTDIKYRLEVISLYVEELENKNSNSDSLKYCLDGLRYTIDRISMHLQSIHQKYTDHQLKYFSYFRKYDISAEIKNLEKDIMILNKRFKLLISLK